MPYLTPNTLPSARICRRLFIPDDIDLVAAVSGALYDLAQSKNWEHFGAQTPEDTAYACLLMLQEYFHSEGCLIGAMMPYAGLEVPQGMLPCDGSVYEREDFPELYAYYEGTSLILDGDHFSTPTWPDRTVIMAGDTYEPFAEVGEAEHTLTEGELAPHGHTSPPHAHSEVTAVPTIINGGLEAPASAATPGVGTTGATSVTINSAGGGEAHNNIQPSIAFQWGVISGRIAAPSPPPESYILFGTGEPNLPDLVSDADDYWLGVRLQTTVPGNYTAIRFYKDASSTGPYRGQIWDDTNAIVAGADFTDTASGWQQVDITPVHTDADTTFTIGVHFPTGEFRRRLNAFDSTYEDYPFRIVGGGENGVYVLVSFGGGDNRPRFVFDNSDYGISVVFEPA